MTHLRPRIVAAVTLPLCLAVSSAGAAFEPTSVSRVQNPRFGFAAGGNLQNLSDTALARYLDGAKAAHAGWIRIDVNWNVIQYNGPTSYDWTRFDNVVNAVRSRGMRVLAGILYTPPWARPAGTSSHSPPSDLEDYARFVRTAVGRYAPMGVHTYEIWNEPNIAGFWAPAPDPARYAQLLELAYVAVKSIDPTAEVVSAGLAPYGSYGQSDSTHMNPLTFLQRMYAGGAKGSFDALGWHPSSYPRGLAFARWSAWSQMARTSPSARSIMAAHGDGGKQIWATEFSYPTGRTPASVSEAAQAALIRKTFSALRRWRWAGPAFVYRYRDDGTDRRALEDNFGVVHYDFSPKPSYRAYQRAATGS